MHLPELITPTPALKLPPQSPVVASLNAARFVDERLGRLPENWEESTTTRLTPAEMAAFEAASAEDARHMGRLNEARDNALRNDAAILSKRDAALLTTLQGGREEDYAQLVATLIGRYPLIRELVGIANAAGPTQAPLALAGSLVTLAAIASPDTRIRVGRHTLPTALMIAAPAPSGAGKDAALSAARAILSRSDCAVTEKLASPQALEDAVASAGPICLLLDEFGTPASGGSKAPLLGTFIDYYSRSGKPAPSRRKVSRKANGGTPGTVMLNAVLMGTPRNLMRQLTPELMVSGLANRLLLLPAFSEASAHAFDALNAPGADAAADPQTVARNLATQIDLARREVNAAAAAAHHAATTAAGSNAGGQPQPPPFGGIELHLEMSPEVDAVLRRMQSFQELSRGHTSDPGFARFRELVFKVAAILQRARCMLVDPLNDTINATDLADAFELVTLSCLMMGRVSHVTGGGIAALGEELWHWLKRQPGEGATQSDFRAKHRRAPYRAEAESWLLERGLIRLTPNLRGGGSRVEAVGDAFPAV